MAKVNIITNIAGTKNPEMAPIFVILVHFMVIRTIWRLVFLNF